MRTHKYERPQKFYTDQDQLTKALFRILNSIIQGKLDNGGELTLATGTTNTTVTSAIVTDESDIHLSPLTANAAAAIPTTYISARTQGVSFVVTHANTATADRTFTYSITG